MFVQLLTVLFTKHNKIYNWFHCNLLLTFYVQGSCHKTQFKKLSQTENNLKTSFSRKLINFFKVILHLYYIKVILHVFPKLQTIPFFILNENSNKLNENSNKLNENSNKLNENSNKLNENSNKLNENSNILNENSNKLNENSKKLKENFF